MVVGQTPRWLAAVVKVMFLSCRSGRRSSMVGTVIGVVR